MFGGIFRGLHILVIAIVCRIVPQRYQDLKVKELPLYAKIMYFLIWGIVIILCEVIVTIVGGGFLFLVEKVIDVAWDAVVR